MGKIVRRMYCPECDSNEEHLICQKGTRQKQDGIWVRYIASCQRCDQRHRFGIVDQVVAHTYCIPINDYNSLVSKEIFSY